MKKAHKISENKEGDTFCSQIWVTSHMVVVLQAKEAVQKILPDDSSTLILCTAQKGPRCTVKDIKQA